MVRITVEEVFRGEKYDVMSAAMAENQIGKNHRVTVFVHPVKICVAIDKVKDFNDIYKNLIHRDYIFKAILLTNFTQLR